MIFVHEIDRRKEQPATAICWRRDLAVPHESIWSRLNKLEVLNRAKLRLFEVVLRDPRIVRNSTYSRGWAHCDLLVCGFRDKGKMRCMSASGYPPTVGALIDYISNAEEDRWIRETWASEELWFCPLCMRVGVHVTYFQLRFVSVCPVHRVPLVNRCPSCKARITYTIGWLSPAQRFACHCGHVLWNWEKNPTNKISESIKAGHAAAGDWICRALKWGGPLHCAWGTDNNDALTMACEGLQTFATFAALACPSFGKLNGNFKSGLEAQMATTRFFAPRCQKAKRRASERKQLIAIYKSICRYFYRRYLRPHRKAIRAVAQIRSGPWAGYDGNITWPKPFGLLAMAFVGWRMYWECLVSPHELFRFHTLDRRINNYTTERTHWTLKTIERFHQIVRCPKVSAPRAIELELKKRWFAQVCFSVFDECLVRIHTAFQKFKPGSSWLERRYTTEHITGVLCPLMVPTIERDGGSTLHWWRRSTTARQKKWAAAAFRTPPSKAECDDFRDATHEVGRYVLERAARINRPERASRPQKSDEPTTVISKIRELKALRTKVAKLEKDIATETKAELGGIHGRLAEKTRRRRKR